MRDHIPQLEELIPTDLSTPACDRLRPAHEALLQAGPLPELPLSLQRPPAIRRRRPPSALPARPRRRYLAAAAALVLATAGMIFDLSSGPTETAARTIGMQATPAAPQASATLTISSRDRAGNSPITLRVGGLPPLAKGSYYEMYPTNKGHLVGGCGTFRTDGGTTLVGLNVPYRLDEYSGWLIERAGPNQPPSQPLLITKT